MRATISMFAALLVGAALATWTLGAGCGGGGGGGGGGAPPVGDISGTWQINETSDASACGGESASFSTYSITVRQDGSSLTVTAPVEGGTQDFSGSISGNKVRWSGSYPNEGGTTTITSMDITIGEGCNTLEGDISWRWTDGETSCSGTATVTGTREGDAGCGTVSPGDDAGGGDGATICENTCPTANDDECDDGGEGSLFAICAYGSDCADCGARPRLDDDCPDMSGAWTITDHCESALIGGILTVVQTGCAITVPDWNFSGTVGSGGEINMSGTPPDAGHFSCTGSVSGTTLSETCVSDEGDVCGVSASR